VPLQQKAQGSYRQIKAKGNAGLIGWAATKAAKFEFLQQSMANGMRCIHTIKVRTSCLPVPA